MASHFTHLEQQLLQTRDLLDKVTAERPRPASPDEVTAADLLITAMREQMIGLLTTAEAMQNRADAAHRILTTPDSEDGPYQRMKLAAAQLAGEVASAIETVAWSPRCPEHDRTDCSPLLNGCTRLTGRR